VQLSGLESLDKVILSHCFKVHQC